MAIDGTGSTVKSAGLFAAWPETRTETGPVVAPAGTVTTISSSVLLTTTAATPLKDTSGSMAASCFRSAPRIRTVAPTGPRPGSRLVMVGVTVPMTANGRLVPAASTSPEVAVATSAVSVCRVSMTRSRTRQ